MPNTTNYKFGQIVLVRFPFTDQRGGKQRPVIGVRANWRIGANWGHANWGQIQIKWINHTRIGANWGQIQIKWINHHFLCVSANQPDDQPV